MAESTTATLVTTSILPHGRQLVTLAYEPSGKITLTAPNVTASHGKWNHAEDAHEITDYVGELTVTIDVERVLFLLSGALHNKTNRTGGLNGAIRARATKIERIRRPRKEQAAS